MVHHRAVRMLCLARAALLGLVAALVFMTRPAMVHADDLPPVQVVASFSVLGDMVKEIGGRHVQVESIVGPNADAHSFEPTPQAVQALANAQVLVSNGLGFEAWLPRLIKSSGFSGEHIVVSNGASLRTLSDDGGHGHGAHDHDAKTDIDSADQDPHAHEHGDVDPHAWQNLKNGMIYADNIADGLSMADPSRASHYQRRVKKYLSTMQKLDAEVRTALAAIPAERRTAVTAHDAFGYFGDEYGIEFIPLAGLANSAEPTAKDIAALIDRLRDETHIGIFPEKVSNPKMIEQLAREANIVVGGHLYSDALDNADEPAGTYLGMFHWNAGQLISVLKSDQPRASD